MSRRLALCAAFLFASVAAAAAESLVTQFAVNMQVDQPGVSGVVLTIPAGTWVEVGKCDINWCAVTYQGFRGYVPAWALDTEPPAARQRRGPRERR